MIASGIDPGSSSCLAVVALDPVRLVRLVPVHGVKWYERMVQAVRLSEGPIWCERPEVKIRRGVAMRNHNSAFGLGRSVGRWEAVAASQQRELHLFTTGEWWNLLPTRPGPKRGNGMHRVDECCAMVRAARPWLEDQPPSRRVDCSEAILIAYAGALRG